MHTHFLAPLTIPMGSTFRYVEAVTPVLASLHPSSIVDSLHFQSCNAVKAQNKLSHGAEDGAAAGEKKDDAPTMTHTDDQESKTSRLQVMISLSKVSKCFYCY